MLKQIIAQNIVFLRKQAGMTQLDLAEKLNYSDKAVSKWERGDSVPDIAVLKDIADLFGVTVDYLLKEDHAAEEEAAPADVAHDIAVDAVTGRHVVRIDAMRQPGRT